MPTTGGIAHDRTRHLAANRPSWSRWRTGGRRYTVGIEEEIMLLDPGTHALVHSSDEVIECLSPELARRATRETHAAVLELSTRPHDCVSDVVAELAVLRSRLSAELEQLGLTAAVAGTHPLATAAETRTSRSKRYQALSESMRFLAYREPTMALHVHVGVPDPRDAVRVLNRLREAVPVLLALSANSAFSQGRDTGFASARTMIFGAFPRTGPPPAFAGYSDYVGAVDPLIASGAIPDHTFLWWDVRLQPLLGTVEVRVMDAQASIEDTAPLVALVQALARAELEGTPLPDPVGSCVLAENRFLAARDGLRARLIDPARSELVTVRQAVGALIYECVPHATRLGCASEVKALGELAAANGADRQRAWVARGGDPVSIVELLERSFLAHQARPDSSAASDADALSVFLQSISCLERSD